MAGFFLVEDTVLSTTKGAAEGGILSDLHLLTLSPPLAGFITRQWVDGVWQAALIAIDRVMEQQLVRRKVASRMFSVTH